MKERPSSKPELKPNQQRHVDNLNMANNIRYKGTFYKDGHGMGKQERKPTGERKK